MSKLQKEVWSDLSVIDCSKMVEKKNGLSYLSWAHAYQILMDRWSDNDIVYSEETYDDGTVMMYCTITIYAGDQKASRTMHLPVMDYRNKAVANPDAFARNTARQRVFTKCLSMHGLGAYIYAGEDLPQEVKEAQEAKVSEEQVKQILKLIADTSSDINKFLNAYNIEKIADLTVKQYELAMKQLNKKLQQSKEVKNEKTSGQK